MRPRRFRRGNLVAERDAKLGEWLASMRPRRFRRGNLGYLMHAENPRIGFNEAPAIPPGKPAMAPAPMIPVGNTLQ